jgi:LPXTG-motif cell wall-anchored protein
MVKSVNSGVVFLLGIVGGVLVGFAALFLFWRKREIQKMNLSAT